MRIMEGRGSTEGEEGGGSKGERLDMCKCVRVREKLWHCDGKRSSEN